MKKISTICILVLLFCILLTSCSAPALAPTPSPKVTIEPTPTSTPLKGPFTEKQAEKMLETLIGRDVTYNVDIDRPSIYQFDYEDTIFWVNKLNGDISTYAKLIVDDKPTNELINKHQALQLVIQSTYENNPTFFDYDVDYEVKYRHKTTCQIYLTQFSQLGRKTGNHVLAWVNMNNGEINSINWDSEDPTIADQDLAISEEKALEIAYEVSINNVKAKIKNNTDIEVELDDRTNHIVETDFFVHKGRPNWLIEIKFPSNVYYTIGYGTLIDANTGEVISCSGYK